MQPAINATIHDALATISLNRPESFNAMNVSLLTELEAALRKCEDHAVRVVVVRGEGGAFCSGGDVKGFANYLNTGAVPLEMPETLHRVIAMIRNLKKPVIAAVHGPCAGAGVSLALACDLTVASDNAIFTMAYNAIGLSADGGSTYFLPRLVGLKKALELCFFSERITADMAFRLGMVNRVVPHAELETTVQALAEKLAVGPTLAFAKTKELLNSSAHHDLVTQLDQETLGIALITQTKDFKEGVTAFVEKRAPHFVGS